MYCGGNLKSSAAGHKAGASSFFAYSAIQKNTQTFGRSDDFHGNSTPFKHFAVCYTLLRLVTLIFLHAARFYQRINTLAFPSLYATDLNRFSPKLFPPMGIQWI